MAAAAWSAQWWRPQRHWWATPGGTRASAGGKRSCPPTPGNGRGGSIIIKVFLLVLIQLLLNVFFSSINSIITKNFISSNFCQQFLCINFYAIQINTIGGARSGIHWIVQWPYKCLHFSNSYCSFSFIIYKSFKHQACQISLLELHAIIDEIVNLLETNKIWHKIIINQ